MSVWPIVLASIACAVIAVSKRWSVSVQRWALPTSVTFDTRRLWQLGCEWARSAVFPTPIATWKGLLGVDPGPDSRRYAVASVFRVAWGFSLAVIVGIPLGLWAGWSTCSFQAVNPLIQGLWPISPIAWIPVAILWFGVGT